MKIHVSREDEVTKTLQDLKLIISKYFSIEDFRWSDQAAVFYILVDEERLEGNFDDLRKELMPQGYVPALAHERNDYMIYVTKKPKIEPRSVVVNLIMFVLTLISTIWAGAVLWAPRTDFEMASDSYGAQLSDIFRMLVTPELLGYGALFFALPLMLILGIHELGHYFMSKKHGVDASLPFFIPIPPFIGPLGTFGAFISMREPMPSKKALMDIGAAGPIAGFIVAIPITMIGLALTGMYPIKPQPEGDFITYLGSPLLFEGLQAIIPIPSDTSIHPTAFAGWVGILVTSMNLLPAGQLDGGHIMRALFGNKSKYVSYMVVIILIVLGFSFAGWWIFTFLILLLGTTHPPPLNDVTKLQFKRKAIGTFSIVMLVICFVPVPIIIEEFVEPEFEVTAIDNELVAGSGEIVNFTIILNNIGEEKDTYKVTIDRLSIERENSNISAAHVALGDFDGDFSNTTEWTIFAKDNEFSVNQNSEDDYVISVKVPVNASIGDRLSFYAAFQSDKDEDVEQKLLLSVKVGELSVKYSDNKHSLHPKNTTSFGFGVKNTGTRTMTVILIAAVNETISSGEMLDNWPEPYFTETEFILPPGETKFIAMNITAPESAVTKDEIAITVRAEDKSDSAVTDFANFWIFVD
jgi:Zn-dependent protease